MNNMLSPWLWQGRAKDISYPTMKWATKLPKNTFCFLWASWETLDLPTGYDLYIVSFHIDVVDVKWLVAQALKVKKPIIVLSDSNYYNYPFPDNVHCYTFYFWHQQISQMQQWFGTKPISKTKTFKFSSICNRVTQSKLWVTIKLLEEAKEQSLVVLSPWLENKNIHGWESSGNEKLDQLNLIYRSKYLNSVIKADDFNDKTDNNQRITSNPWQTFYTDCALNFNNESFHYSFMSNESLSYIHPGPFITEKTLKCLMAGTAFISVGQFDTYNSLSRVGFKFDYGFDTIWDNDPGNITRLASIVDLIEQLNQLSIENIIEQTFDSTQHNYDHIASGRFFQFCESHNDQISQIILDKFQNVPYN